ncbi:AAA family ATPase [Microbacterium sp. ZW T5_45]|uniref:AAA family ATPase n=1 Tax=Microbacterium sp. ZW T5_45 TaxID=3378080 RepID=UPI003853BCB7
MAQLAALSESSRIAYDQQRREWHANIVLRSEQVDRLHQDLLDIVDSNLQDSDRVKSAAAIDAPPTMGKTTALRMFGRDFHRRRIAEVGEYLDPGAETTRHIPVCHVTLVGKPTIKALHQQLLGFYAHPSGRSELRQALSLSRDLARAAADCIARHDTRLIIIDDLHFLNMRTNDSIQVANQLKWLANEYDATFVFAGVALRESGLLREGRTGQDAALAQTFRRWTVLGMTSFALRTQADKREWARLMGSLDKVVVLSNGHPRMIQDLSTYIFVRTGGNIGSLMDLIRRGTSRAIRTGHEKLDRELLDLIRLDEGAESGRADREKKLNRLLKRELDEGSEAEAA